MILPGYACSIFKLGEQSSGRAWTCIAIGHGLLIAVFAIGVEYHSQINKLG